MNHNYKIHNGNLILDADSLQEVFAILARNNFLHDEDIIVSEYENGKLIFAWVF